MSNQHPLGKLLQTRIAIIDGAMGTTIRTYGMKEADIRGERFRDSKKDLLNNGDLFSLTQPQMIGDIHRRFLEAGADIIETNTFGATSITQSEFFVDDPRERGGRKNPEFYQRILEDGFLSELAWEINEQSARQCREWADRVADRDSRPRFVAGALGPTNRTLSLSPDVEDPGYRVPLELAGRGRSGVSSGHLRPGEGGVRSASAGFDRWGFGSAVGGDHLRFAECEGGAGRDSGGLRPER